jgi:hypothetical protein
MKFPSVIAFVCVFTLVVGCTQPAHVTFSVKNSSTNQISVKYFPFETNDTQTVNFGPDTLITFLETDNSTGKSNWFYDYKMHIIGVYNNLGDSTSFDPNVSQYWFLYTGEPNYQYKLDVDDTDF